MSGFSLPQILRWSGLAAILIAGIWLRWPTDAHRARKGVDEGYYERYVLQLQESGLGGFPGICRTYVEKQRAEQYAFLPPTRILFLSGATLWSSLFHTPPLEAVRNVSCAAGMATLLLGVFFAGRMGGWGMAFGAGALLAVAPLLVHLSHRALIDGFFAFWALFTLWALWECLRAPEKVRWLWFYGAGLVAMVLTKENAAFAYAGLFGILALNRWLKIGQVTPRLWAVTLLAPAIGVIGLLVAAGGPGTLIEAYRLNVQKSVILPYAITTGDGPWHRYLLDFIMVSPAVTLLAIAGLVGLPWDLPAKRYLAIFIGLSYVLMMPLRYGMNMRYGAMWELPLCCLAYLSLRALAEHFRAEWRCWATAGMVTIVTALEVQQYQRLFVAGSVYDPVAGAMAMRLNLWKTKAPTP